MTLIYVSKLVLISVLLSLPNLRFNRIGIFTNSAENLEKTIALFPIPLFMALLALAVDFAR